jgi:hypothetical protein
MALRNTRLILKGTGKMIKKSKKGNDLYVQFKILLVMTMALFRRSIIHIADF